MSDQRSERRGGVGGPVGGPEEGATDNASANASPDLAEEILGEHAEDGITDADRGLTPDEHHRAPGDLHQPRTGAETPVDAEHLVHAGGEPATPATLRQDQEALDREGPRA